MPDNKRRLYQVPVLEFRSNQQTSKVLRLNWRTLTSTKHFHFDTFRLATLTALNGDLEAYLKKIGPAGLIRNLSESSFRSLWF